MKKYIIGGLAALALGVGFCVLTAAPSNAAGAQHSHGACAHDTHAVGMRCTFCNGTGFQQGSNFTCGFCGGKGWR